jgi:protein-tyrosine phosphatase
MAAALLRRRLDAAGMKATVSSAGLLTDGNPVTDHGLAVMADRGIDTSGHRSRRLRPDLVEGADLVLGMARSHVREAVAIAGPPVLERAFTLKEIVRLGEERGGWASGEPLEAWLARLGEGRRPADLLGDSDVDDVDDPIGGPRRSYERTADELDDLTARLARLLGIAEEPDDPSARPTVRPAGRGVGFPSLLNKLRGARHLHRSTP